MSCVISYQKMQIDHVDRYLSKKRGSKNKKNSKKDE